MINDDELEKTCDNIIQLTPNICSIRISGHLSVGTMRESLSSLDTVLEKCYLSSKERGHGLGLAVIHDLENNRTIKTINYAYILIIICSMMVLNISVGPWLKN